MDSKRPVVVFSFLLILLIARSVKPGVGDKPNPDRSTPRARGAQTVDPGRELMIIDPLVTEDPERTTAPCRGWPVNPPWSFGHLVEKLALSAGQDPSQFVRDWLANWEEDQIVNGFPVPARRAIQEKLIRPWERLSGGAALDLAKAPFQLLAIVNRMDLREIFEDGRPRHAGQGRIIFGLLDTFPGLDFNCSPAPYQSNRGMNVIFEYQLTAQTAEEVRAWAEAWHELGRYPFGPEYNQALEVLTERFTDHFLQLRTNEIQFEDQIVRKWDMRQFTLAEGRLALSPLPQTPDDSFQLTEALAQFVNDNERPILSGDYRVPPDWLGGRAAVFQGGTTWRADGIRNGEARHRFALGTCGGCHLRETGTVFVHVGLHPIGRPPTLSGFMTGITVIDPVDRKTPRRFDELGRRKSDLEALLNSQALQPYQPALRE